MLRSPPSFSYHMAVSHNHQAVHAVDLLVERIYEIQHRRGGDALCFRPAARQGSPGTTNASRSSENNDGADSNQRSHGTTTVRSCQAAERDLRIQALARQERELTTSEGPCIVVP